MKKCKHCDESLPMYLADECDRCWELRTRIEADPVLAWRMLKALDESKGNGN